MAGPVISALTYTVTDSTIVATWTTDASADSNLAAGANSAIDNGVAANGTSHQCICANLLPNTVYSCVVTSTSAGGTTSSTPQNVTTSAAQARNLVTAAGVSSVSTVATAPHGDTYRTFVSNDNKTYITQDDGNGFVNNSPNVGYNTELGVLTDEVNMAGTLVSLANYGNVASGTGTDGPAGDNMQNKSTGLFGLNGNLHCFVYRQYPPTYSTNRYCNWIKSTNHGATWNNFNQPSTFTAAGNVLLPQSPSEPIQFYVNTIGIVSPVMYAADDGTLGYNTAGNQIDGGNAYVYCSFVKDNTPLYMLRIPRIQFDAQTTSAFEYWVGPATPAVADFVNQSNWSASPTSATVILSTAQVGAWWQIAFVPGINSYIMSTWASTSPGPVLNFYSAPTPAGPWKLFFQQLNSTSGSKWYGPFPFHRDLLGNTSTNNIPVRMLFQGESGVGTHYRPNWFTLTLTTNAPLPSVVQGYGAGNGAGQGTTPYTQTFQSNVTNGNLLVVGWRRITSGATVTSVTDTLAGNPNGNWNIVYDTSTGGVTNGGWAWVFTKASGACTVHINMSASVGGGVVEIGEWTGVNAARTPFPAAATGSASLAPTSNSLTTVVGDLLIGVCTEEVGQTTIVGIPGYTVEATGTTTAPKTYGALEDGIASSTSSIAQFTGDTSSAYAAGIGAFYYIPPVLAGNAGSARLRRRKRLDVI